MLRPRLSPTIRRLPSDRPYTSREVAVAAALASIAAFGPKEYHDLQVALGQLGEDALHDALTDLLEALACEHGDDCACFLREHGSAVDREALDAVVSGRAGGELLLARAFIRWCWRHWRREVRHGLREVGASGAMRTDDRDGIASHALDLRGEQDALHPPRRSCVERCEEQVDGTGHDHVLEHLLTQSGCSERESDAYVETESRAGREFGNALADSVRTATTRARRKLRSCLSAHGVLSFEDLEIAIDEGVFASDEYASAA